MDGRLAGVEMSAAPVDDTMPNDGPPPGRDTAAAEPATKRPSSAGGVPPGTARAAVARTMAPPWHGGLNVALLFAAAAWVITYTLLPLPGQRHLGDWNYLGAVVLFVAALVVTRVLRVAAMRRFRAERTAALTPARPDRASQDDPSST